MHRLRRRRRSRTRSPVRSAAAASCPCRATTSPSANSRGRVAWRRLKASSCRVRPAPRSTDCLISSASSRAGIVRPSCISSRSAAPMMLIRMLLKSCATPPASRPIASSFCDCRSCSSSARRSVMSRTNPVRTARLSAPMRATVSSTGNSVPSARSARQLELPAGQRPAAGRHVLVERRRPAAARSAGGSSSSTLRPRMSRRV